VNVDEMKRLRQELDRAIEEAKKAPATISSIVAILERIEKLLEKERITSIPCPYPVPYPAPWTNPWHQPYYVTWYTRT
jgi:hypothetical protein